MKQQPSNQSTLYLIPTPIGNLADMTYRAVQILNQVDLIYAEDTRTSGVLLKHYDIKTPMKSYHKFNEKARCEEIINHLKNKRNIAVISDAGTPGISDPSNVVVKAVVESGFQVTPLPGATAMIPALVASGFDTKHFFMAGFCPEKKKDRESLFKKLQTLEVPIIFYESPHRLNKFFSEIKEYFFDADICIARELSKVFETFYRGKLDEIIQNIDHVVLKGEFVIIVVPKKVERDFDTTILELFSKKYSDLSVKKASQLIASELDISKNKVYEILTGNGNAKCQNNP